MKTTEEKNQIIAEFMGFKLNDKIGTPVLYNDKTCEVLDTDKILYHNSWEWLIPVVNKIKSIDDSFTIVEVGIYDTVENDEIPEISHYEYDICETYEEVVRLITWYRDQNKNHEKI